MKEKFVIVSDSCCELTEELRKKYDVDYIPMYVSYDDKSLKADLDWKELSASDFYDIMRKNVRIFTSQASPIDYEEKFEEYLKNGFDILSISCSSALSATYKSSCIAKEELAKKYPSSKIICIDSLTCSYGLGILCILASNLRASGKNIDDVAQEIERIKMNVNQIGTVDELKYLKRAGRISSSKALIGAMLNVKPIIVSNQKGENVSTEKNKGRIKSIRRIAELAKEKYTGEQIDELFISHGDCELDALKLKEFILELTPNAKITIGMLNPIVGASCGPKTLVLYFVGKEKPNTDCE